ncbi:hypothetical protein D3C71_79470 [compost metagenome]
MPYEAKWVPPEDRDTRWYLWNELFLCRVPFMQTMSKDYVRIHGVPFTGHVESDRATHQELVQRMLSINQMTEFFKHGTNVSVCKHEDTKRIYEYISNHLRAWKRELEVSLDVRNAPLEDLKMLDRLAASVYVHAQEHMSEAIIDSILARRIAGTMRLNRSNFMVPKSNATKINAIEEVPYEPKLHPSMAELISSHELAAKPSWK